jgi:hypothetical protein
LPLLARSIEQAFPILLRTDGYYGRCRLDKVLICYVTRRICVEFRWNALKQFFGSAGRAKLQKETNLPLALQNVNVSLFHDQVVRSITKHRATI